MGFIESSKLPLFFLASMRALGRQSRFSQFSLAVITEIEVI